MWWLIYNIFYEKCDAPGRFYRICGRRVWIELLFEMENTQVTYPLKNGFIVYERNCLKTRFFSLLGLLVLQSLRQLHHSIRGFLKLNAVCRSHVQEKKPCCSRGVTFFTTRFDDSLTHTVSRQLTSHQTHSVSLQFVMSRYIFQTPECIRRQLSGRWSHHIFCLHFRSPFYPLMIPNIIFIHHIFISFLW